MDKQKRRLRGTPERDLEGSVLLVDVGHLSTRPLSAGHTCRIEPCIPDKFRGHDEGSIVDARQPNRDEVHAMTSMKRFRRKLLQ